MQLFAHLTPCGVKHSTQFVLYLQMNECKKCVWWELWSVLPTLYLNWKKKDAIKFGILTYLVLHSFPNYYRIEKKEIHFFKFWQHWQWMIKTTSSNNLLLPWWSCHRHSSSEILFYFSWPFSENMKSESHSHSILGKILLMLLLC